MPLTPDDCNVLLGFARAGLASLSHRIASGYERLEHLDGARRFAAKMARHARRRTGIVVAPGTGEAP